RSCRFSSRAPGRGFSLAGTPGAQAPFRADRGVADCPMLEDDRAMNSPSMPAMIESTSAPALLGWWRGAGRRVRAPLLHAAASLAVAITVSVIVFVLWFPGALAT